LAITSPLAIPSTGSVVGALATLPVLDLSGTALPGVALPGAALPGTALPGATLPLADLSTPVVPVATPNVVAPAASALDAAQNVVNPVLGGLAGR
jgi:hypothetical protein